MKKKTKILFRLVSPSKHIHQGFQALCAKNLVKNGIERNQQNLTVNFEKAENKMRIKVVCSEKNYLESKVVPKLFKNENRSIEHYRKENFFEIEKHFTLIAVLISSNYKAKRKVSTL